MDIIRELGPLALASRLKRISERLMRDVARVYDESDLDFQPRWFPVLYLLGQKSPMAVTEIARALQMTHPAINQIASGMIRAGILSSKKDTADERKRMLSITPEGGRLMALLVPVWRDIDSATGELLEGTGINLLEGLDRIEKALDENDMYRRVKARIKKHQYDAVEIVDYEPRWRKEFERLNVEWLKKYFSVEPYDRALLTDPERRIIYKGGFILFARLMGHIVGTVAVLYHDDGSYEMAKMAVTEEAQGKQVGKRLACAAIERAADMGARELMLYTSPKLTAANNLYRKLGFEEIEAEQPTKFERLSITMMMQIDKMQISNRSEP